MRKTRLPALALAAAAALALPTAALAADTQTSNTQIALSGGNLQFTTKAVATNFAALTLNGQVRHVNTSIGNWGVNDATGSGKGWTVNFTASQFTGTNVANKLPTSSLNYTVPSLVTPGDPLNILQAPTLVTPGTALTIDAPGGATVASAGAGKGAGVWNYTQANLTAGDAPSVGDLALTVPSATAADTYTSTITETLSPNP